jgi:uncharacterized protein YuzE
MAEIKISMGLDPFKVVHKAIEDVEKFKAPNRIVAIDYDEEADILYVKFRHTKIVDNEPLDKRGLVLASLDQQGQVAGLIIMEASKFTSP